MIVSVSDATFEGLVLRSELPVLLDFTAGWCPPCRMIKPVLRELSDELAGQLVIAEIDVDENPATAAAAGVLGMPTLNLYIGGRVATQIVGARSKPAFRQAIAEHLPAVAASA